MTLRGVITPASLGVMTQTTSNYLAKFGVDGSLTNHHFDPCPVSGRCGVCGVAAYIHPVGPIRTRTTR